MLAADASTPDSTAAVDAGPVEVADAAAGDAEAPSSDAAAALLPPVVAAPVVAAPAALPPSAPVVEEKGSGTVSGTIRASEDEGSVEDARVYVRGEALETRSDSSGAFSLAVPSGVHQLSIIHPGFATLTVSKVEVRPGKTVTLDLSLRPASVEMDEMVVTGSHIKGGIATLIAERRETSAVADVIGAEQMARSGDTNAATALSRVTGITVIDGRYVIVRGMGERYSTMTLNRLQVPSPDPTRRVVPLDIFPAGVIDSVVVQKSFSPDLPGEFGGGLVQLRSRDYPKEFTLNLNVATGGNTNALLQERVTYEGGKRDYLGADDGTRALPDNFNDPRGKLVVKGRFDETGYTAEEIAALGKELPNNLSTKKETAYPDLTLGASVGDRYRLRHAKIGFVAAAGYRSEYRSIIDGIDRLFPAGESEPNEDFLVDIYRRQISLSGFLDWGVEFSDRQKLKFTTMLLRQTDDSTQLRDGYDANVDTDTKRSILSWVERQILLQQVSGMHKFEQLREFQIDWRYAFARATRYEPDRREVTYQQESDTGAYIIPGANGIRRVYGDLDDDTHEGGLDLTQPFRVWSRLEAKAKVGGLLYYRKRVADVRRFNYFVGEVPVETRQGPPEGVIGGDAIGTTVDFIEDTLETDAYDADMQIEAGYGMLELPILKSLDIMGGARVEHATINVTTFAPFDADMTKVTASLDDVDVLPAASATWRFVEDFQLRAGYSKTLNRPDFRELSPSRYYDLDANLLLVGNPNIKRALIQNYDLRVEWYYTPDEVFSIGGFFKQFQDPIEQTQGLGAERFYTVTNADKAVSMGLEVEGRKRFGFMSKALEAMYLAANFSLITSTVDVIYGGDGLYHRPLQGQSPWVVNMQLGWDDSDEGGTGTSASLLFNTAGQRIRFVGSPEMMLGDIYEQPIHRLDFVMSQELPHKLKLGVRARNLLNAEERWTQSGNTLRLFKRGADFQVSLAWSY